MRNEAPGAIFTNEDIGGRPKVLFDVLRIPHNEDEAVTRYQDQSKCFCLLEVDSLIRNLMIVTSRLLEPIDKDSDIQLHIHTSVIEDDQ